jgi:hypothetical protein
VQRNVGPGQAVSADVARGVGVRGGVGEEHVAVGGL